MNLVSNAALADFEVRCYFMGLGSESSKRSDLRTVPATLSIHAFSNALEFLGAFGETGEPLPCTLWVHPLNSWVARSIRETFGNVTIGVTRNLGELESWAVTVYRATGNVFPCLAELETNR